MKNINDPYFSKMGEEITESDIFPRARLDSYFESKNTFLKNKTIALALEKTKTSDLVFILGNPLAGKTRLIFEIIKEIYGDAEVFILRPKKDSEYNFKRVSESAVIVIDDFDNFIRINKEETETIILRGINEGFKIIISQRRGPEYSETMQSLSRDILELIEQNKIVLEKFDAVDLLENETLKGRLNDDRYLFDGNIGSLFSPLLAMKSRYESLEIDERYIEKEALDTLKLYYLYHNYEGLKSRYSYNKIKYFVEKKTFKDDLLFTRSLDYLSSTDTRLNFLRYDDEFIYIDESYLDIAFDGNNYFQVIENVTHENKRAKLKEVFKDRYYLKAFDFPVFLKDYNQLITNSVSLSDAWDIYNEISRNQITPTKKTFEPMMALAKDLEDKLKVLAEAKKYGVKTYYGIESLFLKSLGFEEMLHYIKTEFKHNITHRTGITELLKSKMPQNAFSIILKYFTPAEIISSKSIMHLLYKITLTPSEYKTLDIKNNAPKTPGMGYYSLRLAIKNNDYETARPVLEENALKFDSFRLNIWWGNFYFNLDHEISYQKYRKALEIATKEGEYNYDDAIYALNNILLLLLIKSKYFNLEPERIEKIYKYSVRIIKDTDIKKLNNSKSDKIFLYLKTNLILFIYTFSHIVEARSIINELYEEKTINDSSKKQAIKDLDYFDFSEETKNAIINDLSYIKN